MKPARHTIIASAVLPAFLLSLSLQAATVTKSATGTDLADPASWGGTAPTSADFAAWDATSLGAGLTLGSAASWQGIAATGALSNISVTGAGNLTLGADGIDLSASTVNLALAHPVTLGATQTWRAASGKTITVSGPISGSAPLTLGFGVTSNYSAYLTGTATTVFNNLTLSNVTAASGLMGGASIAGGNGNYLASTGYAFLNNGTTASYQMRILDGGFTKCVKVELAQSGANVTGRVLYAKYISGSNLNNDFDVTGTTNTIATSNGAGGYGAAGTTLSVGATALGEITLSGPNTFTGATTIVTTVKAGVATVPGVSGALGNNAPIIFSNLPSAVLNLNGFNTQVGSISDGLGASVVLGGATLTTGSDNSSVNFQGKFSGSGGLVKTGSGIQTLSTVGNSSTGGVTVNDGTLKLTGAAGFDAGFFSTTQTYTVNTGGTLEFQGDWLTKSSSTYNVSGGTLAFTKTTGDTTISYVNNLNLTNGTVIGPATYRIGNNTTATHTFSGDSGNVVSSGFGLVKNGAAQTVNLTVSDGLSDADLLVSGVIYDVSGFTGSTLNKQGAGKLVLSGANTYVGPTTITAGTLQIGNGGASGKIGAGALTNNAALVFKRSDVSSFANGISGTGSVTVASGTVNLSGTNSHTGPTSVTGGRLNVNSALTAGAVTVTGGTLGGTGSLATATVGSGALVEAGSANAGTLTASTLNLDSGAGLKVAPGTSLLSVTTLNANGSNLINIAGAAPAPGTYTLVDYTGAIGGTGTGFGSFSLGAFDTPRVSATLVDNSSNSSIDLLVSVVDKAKWTGATNGVWDASTQNWKEVVSGNATAFLQGDDVRFDDSAVGNTSVSLDVAVTISALTFNNGALAYNISGTGSIGGAATLTKSGTGLLTLATSNSFTGNVFLNGGTVSVSSLANSGLASPLGAGSSLIFDGGTLAYTAAAASTNRSVTLNVGGGTVSVADTITLSGVVSGSGSLAMIGPGGLALTASNTFSGGATVAGGRLIGSNNTSFGTGTITIGTGSGNSSLFLANRADVANPITVSAAGTGTVTIGAADTNPGSNASTFYGLITLNRPTTFSGEVAADRLAIEGQITGNVGTLTVAGGARTTFFSTANNFVGDLIITGTGTILQASVATASEVIPNNASVTVEAGAFLQLASTTGTESINALNGAGTVRTFPTSAFGSSLTVGAADGSGSFSGSLVNGFGALSFIKTGAGTQALSGPNTFTGGTTVNSGILQAGSSSALGTGAVTVNGGTLDLGGQTLTNTAAIGAAGTVSGSGSLGATALNGTVAPGGSSLGLVSLASATIGSTANIAFQLGALGTNTRGADFDALDVAGALALDGTVTVTLNGLTAAANQQFDLINCVGGIDVTNFDVNTDLVLPSLPAGLGWDRSEFASDGVVAIITTDPLPAWAATYSLTGNNALPGADPDGDGISNALEYAFGTNPTQNNGPEYRGVAATSSGALTLTYRRPLNGVSGVTYGVEFKTADLVVGNTGWTTGVLNTDYTEIITPNGDGTTETVVISLSGVVSGKKFARVAVAY